jgi:hypothetical protein
VEEISEQKIGERVFHRPPEYNPNEDNIVRSQARLLRQKLEAYFATEGAGEPMVLRIPKGGYVPEFIERTPEPVLTPVTEIQPVTIAPAPSTGPNLVLWLSVGMGILSIAVVLLSILLVRSKASPEGTASPALNALWSQLLSDKVTTTIVIPDHTFALLEEAAGKKGNLDDYVRRIPPGDNEASRMLNSLLPRFPGRRYTTFDSVTTAVRVMQIAQKFSGHVVVRFARDIAMRDLSPGNAVLIGRPSTNLWAQLYESKLHFHMYSDYENHRVICKNSAPQPGEPAEFVSKLENGRLEGYSSIAFLKNLNGGNVLLIGGPASSSQEGAGDFVTNEKLFATLGEKILKDGRIPYFDALLKTTTVDGMTQEPSLAAYHILASN